MTLKCSCVAPACANGSCQSCLETRVTLGGSAPPRGQLGRGFPLGLIARLLNGVPPCPLPFFFIISAMSPVMLSVSSQNGDKWHLSCCILRGHLLFISMMGKMP